MGIKRWTSSIVARVDSMVAQIENHEALADIAIKEHKKNVARAKTQLSSVRRDGGQLQHRILELQNIEQRWHERARSCMDDEEKALACLRRKKLAVNERAVLENRLTEHLSAQKQLEADVAKLSGSLSELEQQRNLMRTRHSRAKAMEAVKDSQGKMSGEVADIFERWELHITEAEMNGNCGLSEQDFLEQDFEAMEETDELMAELAALKQEK